MNLHVALVVASCEVAACSGIACNALANTCKLVMLVARALLAVVEILSLLLLQQLLLPKGAHARSTAYLVMATHLMHLEVSIFALS